MFSELLNRDKLEDNIAKFNKFTSGIYLNTISESHELVIPKKNMPQPKKSYSYFKIVSGLLGLSLLLIACIYFIKK